jgi:dihydrofolate synthase/folylpolyglutamate synthase
VIAALDYLLGLEQFGIKFGLDNIRAILERLDHPERAFRSVHIAGTNGKGSVTAMVDAALRAAGHRTARYTSPHLIRLNERFVIDGRAVEDQELFSAIEVVRDAVEGLRREGALAVQPTFFEATTAVAFELFRRAGSEVAVVEVGLGGRLDATNVLTPMATAITSIAFDHQLYLGSTLRDIAIEKAGIIKPSIPVVVGDIELEAMTAIEEIAAANRAPVVRARVDDLGDRVLALRGLHQRINAAIALQLLRVVDAGGIAVPRRAADEALRHVEWPGRIDLRVLPDGREVLLDAAHNPAGAAALAGYLRDGERRLPLVFAAMRDKDVAGMLSVLLPVVRSLIVTRASNARSAPPDELADLARTIAPDVRVTVESSLAAALESAWQDHNRILVAGSIFLLGDVMERLGLHC